MDFCGMSYWSFIYWEDWLDTICYGRWTSTNGIYTANSRQKCKSKRGTIYDATGKNILAISSTVNTITVNPTNISKNDKEKVSKALSDIFDLDYEKVLKKVKKEVLSKQL